MNARPTIKDVLLVQRMTFWRLRAKHGPIGNCLKWRGRKNVCFRQGCEVPGERCGSEAVALRHPVMPVANGFCGGWVGINGDQL